MIRIIPETLYSPGTRIIDIPASVNRAFSGISVRFTRVAWPEGQNILSVYCDYTPDSGATWHQLGGAAFPGGVQIYPRTGEVLTINSVFLPTSKDGDARIRVTNTVELRTAITAETIDA